ncbi:ISL3 family transposase [Azospirillum sp. B510]|uniref:ISL3 family transposase n=1 Tax=Azospirillum sp. (strain B510) TaxID=137722 RepID=UPI000B34A3EB|nr:ISL3 family transposase [Azospirillum sp. B510]
MLDTVLSLNLSLHSIGFLPGLHIIDQIDHGSPRITLRAQQTTVSAPCTACGTPSRRIHGSYWRSLGDLACFGRPTVLLVRVRRFRCTAPTCSRRTFAESLPGIAQRRGRQTDRLRSVHRSIGLALGGNPGARHATAMGMPISRTTLLHRVRAGGTKPIPPVTVLGVDDWAWRKGHRYGTILCDLERRRVIDLLPDRSADTLAAWLMMHPGISVVARDRAGAYAEGAARGAPEAIQVADRWHLLRNASDALRGVLEHHHRDLREAAQTAALKPEPLTLEENNSGPATASETERPLRAAERRSRAAQERRDARFAEVARLREQGMALKAIARTTGIERKTVRRWLRAGHAPTWRHAARATSILDPYRAHLEERWQAGCHNGAALWRDLKGQGFAGQYSVVRNWAMQRRREDPSLRKSTGPRRHSAATRVTEPPTPRRAVRLLTVDLDVLSEEDRQFVVSLRDRSPAIATAADLISRFTTMVKDKTPTMFDGWLREAEASALGPFAAGIRRDEDAVRAALTEPWSSGQVEGHVNRLKVIKRDMYGRAGFDLLRSRVLAHA